MLIMRDTVLGLAFFVCTARGHRIRTSFAELRDSALATSKNQLRVVNSSSGKLQATNAFAHVLLAFSPVLRSPFYSGRHAALQCSRRGPIHMSGASPGVQELRNREARKEVFHRWISEKDPTFQEYVTNKAVYGIPERFAPTRQDGIVPGSSRLQFLLPGEDEPKTIELLKSRGYDNPSFGAVRVKLPIGATIVAQNSRLVVKSVEEQSNVERAGIRANDIVRAMSLPQAQASQGDHPWWTLVGRRPLPDAEEGLVILDGEPASLFDEALRQNLRVNGEQAEVVLLIERPVTISASMLDEEYALRAYDTYTDNSGELGQQEQTSGMEKVGGSETEKVGSSTVYVAKLPFNKVLDGLDTALQDAGVGELYPGLMEHSVILVQHDGQRGFTAYDFLVQDDFMQRLTPAMLTGALTGLRVPGVLRKFPLRRMPRRKGTKRVGTVRPELGSPADVDKAIEEFQKNYDTDMVIFAKDCRHFEDALVRYLVEGEPEKK